MTITYLTYWIQYGKPHTKEFTSKLNAYRHLVELLEADETIECKIILKKKPTKKG